MKESVVIIVNPISGTKGKSRIIQLLNERLDKEKFDVRLLKTQYKGHAEKIAIEEKEKKTDVVIAVGGDGTINEVGKGLAKSDTAMGIIPCGSGNGFARHLQIPMDIEKAIDVINVGRKETVDYGMMNDHPFFCTCGVGFDAHISMEFAKKHTRGLMTYVKTTISEFFKYRPETYVLKTENDEIKCKSFLITAANASQYGNNAYIAPDALITDGLLDVVILSPFRLYEVPILSHCLFHKSIKSNSHVNSIRCEKLVIHREKQGCAHFDGEPIELGKDIDIRIEKKGLKVIIPSKLKEF